MDYSSRVRLGELNVGDRFCYHPFADVYELIGKPDTPYLPIRHLEGTCYPHGTILYLGRTAEVKVLQKIQK